MECRASEQVEAASGRRTAAATWPSPRCSPCPINGGEAETRTQRGKGNDRNRSTCRILLIGLRRVGPRETFMNGVLDKQTHFGTTALAESFQRPGCEARGHRDAGGLELLLRHRRSVAAERDDESGRCFVANLRGLELRDEGRGVLRPRSVV